MSMNTSFTAPGNPGLPGDGTNREPSSNSADRGNPVLNPDTVIRENGPGTPVEYIVGLSYKKFFKVGEIEYRILKLLDGTHTPEAIRQEFLATRDLEVPLDHIRAFINELASLELVSFNSKVKPRRCLNVTLPDFLYRWFSLLYRPLPLAVSILLSLVGLVFFILDTREIFTFITPYFSLYFAGIFILVYSVTSVFHELGHGAAIRYFDYKPGPIQIKRGNGLFLLHYSTPFIIYSPDKVISRKMKLTIVSGGLLFDFLVLAVGAVLFRAGGEVIKVAAVLLQLTALSRILLTINFFNENTDLAKALVYYFDGGDVDRSGSLPGKSPRETTGASEAGSAGDAGTVDPKGTKAPRGTDFKKHFLYKTIGTLFWLLQYSVFFFILYMILYSVRTGLNLPFPEG